MRIQNENLKSLFWGFFYVPISIFVNKKIIIQGFPGAFHEEAALKYQPGLEIVPAKTFEALAKQLTEADANTIAIMAIENSIAGSLLQNYRLLREGGFTICGEVMLRIKHNLMVLPGQNIHNLKEVHSHPMAINQCLEFFKNYPSITLVESNDTALSAMEIKEQALNGIGAIASIRAAELYGLDPIHKGIETSKFNYTRFFVIDKHTCANSQDANKASIYLRVSDQPGQLLRVMELLAQANMNMSKLQSYPVLGQVGAYYFYLDIEFTDVDVFWKVFEKIKKVTLELQALGIYKKSEL